MSPRAAFRCAEGWFQGSLRSAGRGKRLLARGRADARPSRPAAVTPLNRGKSLRLCVSALKNFQRSNFNAQRSTFCGRGRPRSRLRTHKTRTQLAWPLSLTADCAGFFCRCFLSPLACARCGSRSGCRRAPRRPFRRRAVAAANQSEMRARAPASLFVGACLSRPGQRRLARRKKAGSWRMRRAA